MLLLAYSLQVANWSWSEKVRYPWVKIRTSLHLRRCDVSCYIFYPPWSRASFLFMFTLISSVYKLLSAQRISSIEFGLIIKSLSLCFTHKMSWTLYRSQSSTDLHQTCRHFRALILVSQEGLSKTCVDAGTALLAVEAVPSSVRAN